MWFAKEHTRICNNFRNNRFNVWVLGCNSYFEYADRKIFSVKSTTPYYMCKHLHRNLFKEKHFFLRIRFGQFTSYESTTSLAITDTRQGLDKNSLPFLTEISHRKWSSYYITMRLKYECHRFGRSGLSNRN